MMVTSQGVWKGRKQQILDLLLGPIVMGEQGATGKNIYSSLSLSSAPPPLTSNHNPPPTTHHLTQQAIA
ncbi:hypothetical protein GBA52_008544 [Prunus armeniaca]|nr:hypothetical protein GBA52_008544 [Prunus armeniaca]